METKARDLHTKLDWSGCEGKLPKLKSMAIFD